MYNRIASPMYNKDTFLDKVGILAGIIKIRLYLFISANCSYLHPFSSNFGILCNLAQTEKRNWQGTRGQLGH